MIAPSGGGRPLGGARSPLSPVLDRSEAGQGGARPEPRSLGDIFPSGGNGDRARELQGTWRTFCQDMTGAVEAALDRGRSPPEIAYAIGELAHNYFRTRGATLTSYELRRLVAELLVQHGCGKLGEGLVSFDDTPARTPWAGDEPACGPLPSVPETVFEEPLSPLASLPSREVGSFDRFLAQVLERVSRRVVSWERDAVVQQATR